VTGGDSFLYLTFTTQPNSNDAMLFLSHQGKYPVYDVSIQMSDQDEFDQRLQALGLKDNTGSITRDQMIELSKSKATFNYAAVRPNTGLIVIETWQLPSDKDLVRYRFAIFTRNGIFSESLNLQRVNGSWVQALRVLRSMGSGKAGVLVYERVDPEFPRDRGKIQW
jgi:hypothetical protein